MERMNDLLLDVQIGSAGWGDVMSPLSDGVAAVTVTTPPPQNLPSTQILPSQPSLSHSLPQPQRLSPNPAPPPNPAASPSTRFLTYAPIRIFDPFFASRLNNWRATQLLISLIEDPMWGLYNGTRFVCAVDLCRTHAALGEERNFLGAEKAVGLYLAGVVFGGPQMYEVGFPPNVPLPGGFSSLVRELIPSFGSPSNIPFVWLFFSDKSSMLLLQESPLNRFLAWF